MVLCSMCEVISVCICVGLRAGMCTEAFHCRLASTDDDDALPPQFPICEACQRFGKLTMHALVRHAGDAGMVTPSCPLAEVNRAVCAALQVPPALGPEPARSSRGCLSNVTALCQAPRRPVGSSAGVRRGC